MRNFTTTPSTRLHIMVMCHWVNIPVTTATADSVKIKLPAEASLPTQSTCVPMCRT